MCCLIIKGFFFIKVEASAVDKVIQHVKKNYNGKPTIYVCTPSDGAQIVSNWIVKLLYLLLF